MIRETTCKSWGQFKELLAGQIYGGEPAGRRDFLFRGHGNSNWPLAPSFDRAFVDFHDRGRDKLEDDLIENFRKECEAEEKYRDILSDDIQTLALA
ncbi:MAG: FRG domain-containing protein [Planctomycetaceae bacterium]|nr:FRG domain-containing protein [Planctomycetaceae bacterium]